jgi:uncharacterized membrane protein YfcA
MKKKHLETSKAVLLAVLIFCGLFAVGVLIGWFKSLDDALGILALVFAMATLIVKFYMAKAARENVLKIKRTNKLTDEQISKLLALAETAAGQRTGQNPQG